ncbi:hypothetical protein DV515_00004126 [Chloebia gouldiae]|uniref:Uncharacterized protein n=1 Tax=Chloebia gouldiae TaxID=44316 RepID=A0A3L8SRN3_CHLGU|nr:hypothetical protein DV515_00004126 [Chloebia gouldiae]
MITTDLVNSSFTNSSIYFESYFTSDNPTKERPLDANYRKCMTAQFRLFYSAQPSLSLGAKRNRAPMGMNI